MTEVRRISGFTRSIFQIEGQIAILFEICAPSDLQTVKYPKKSGRGALARLNRMCIIRNPGILPGFLRLYNPFAYVTVEVMTEYKPPVPQGDDSSKHGKKKKKQKTGDEEMDDDDGEEEPHHEESDQEHSPNLPELDSDKSEDDIQRDLEETLRDDDAPRLIPAPNNPKKRRIIDDEDEGEGEEAEGAPEEAMSVEEPKAPQFDDPQASFIYSSKCTSNLEEFFFTCITSYTMMYQGTWGKICNALAGGFFVQPLLYHAMTKGGDSRFDAMEFLEYPTRFSRTNNAAPPMDEEEKKYKGISLDFFKTPGVAPVSRKDPKYEVDLSMKDFSKKPKKPNDKSNTNDNTTDPGKILPNLLAPISNEEYTKALLAIVDINPDTRIKELDEDMRYFQEVKMAYWKKMVDLVALGVLQVPDVVKRIQCIYGSSKFEDVTIAKRMKEIYPYFDLIWTETRPAGPEEVEKLVSLKMRYDSTRNAVRGLQDVRDDAEDLAKAELDRTCGIHDARLPACGVSAGNICSAVQLFSALGRPSFDVFFSQYLWSSIVHKFTSESLNRPINTPVVQEVSPYVLAAQFGCKLPEGAWLPPFMAQATPPFCMNSDIKRGTPDHQMFLKFLELFIKSKHSINQDYDINKLMNYDYMIAITMSAYLKQAAEIDKEYVKNQTELDSGLRLEAYNPSDYALFWKRNNASPMELVTSEFNVQEFMEACRESKERGIPKIYVTSRRRLNEICYCMNTLDAVRVVPHGYYDTLNPEDVSKYMKRNGVRSVFEDKDFKKFETKPENTLLVICPDAILAQKTRNILKDKTKNKTKTAIVLSFDSISAGGARAPDDTTKRIEKIVYDLQSLGNDSDKLKFELYKLLTGYKQLDRETFDSNKGKANMPGVDVVFVETQQIEIISLCKSIREVLFENKDKPGLAFWVGSVSFCCNSLVMPNYVRLGFSTPKYLKQWAQICEKVDLLDAPSKTDKDEFQMEDVDIISSLGIVLDQDGDTDNKESEGDMLHSAYDKNITASYVVDSIKKIIIDRADLIQGKEAIVKHYNTTTVKQFLSIQDYHYLKLPPATPNMEMVEIGLLYARDRAYFQGVTELFIDYYDWSINATLYDWLFIASSLSGTQTRLKVLDVQDKLRPFDFAMTLETAITKSKKCIVPNFFECVGKLMYDV